MQKSVNHKVFLSNENCIPLRLEWHITPDYRVNYYGFSDKLSNLKMLFSYRKTSVCKHVLFMGKKEHCSHPPDLLFQQIYDFTGEMLDVEQLSRQRNSGT